MEQKVVNKNAFICEEENGSIWVCFPYGNCSFGWECVYVCKAGLFAHINSFCDKGDILPCTSTGSA